MKCLLVFLLLLPVIAIAHYIAFPQETRCILIGFSDFERSGNIYYKKNISPGKLQVLQQIMASAEKKDRLFWQDNTIVNYKLICCSTEKDFNKYAPAGTPAATNMKLGAYIVIKDAGIDENIIAHEIAHTILYRNIGWYKRTFIIPTWFDEGLAMQVDDRDYYSIDSLLAKKNAGLSLPDVTKLKNPSNFFSGDNETVMLNYATAKYIVHDWLKTHSLKSFIEALKRGKSFEKAYGKNE